MRNGKVRHRIVGSSVKAWMRETSIGDRFGAGQMGGLCLEWMGVTACLVNAQCGNVWRALRIREWAVMYAVIEVMRL